MKDLIKIEVNENQEPIVSGRELYQALEIKTPYTRGELNGKITNN